MGEDFDVGGSVDPEQCEVSEEVEDLIFGSCRAVSVEWRGQHGGSGSVPIVEVFLCSMDFLRVGRNPAISRNAVEGSQVGAGLILGVMCRDYPLDLVSNRLLECRFHTSVRISPLC
jgi:hypothetical protein